MLLLFSAVEKAVMYLERDELPPHWDREILFNMGEESTTESSESEEIDDDDDDESPEDKDHLVRKIKFIFELKFSLLLPNLQMKTKQWNVDNLNLFVLASNSAHIFKNHSQCSGYYCDAHQTTTRNTWVDSTIQIFLSTCQRPKK